MGLNSVTKKNGYKHWWWGPEGSKPIYLPTPLYDTSTIRYGSDITSKEQLIEADSSKSEELETDEDVADI